MDQNNFSQLLHAVDGFSPSQKEQLLNRLRFDGSSIDTFLIENHTHDCPHCHSEELRPWGSSHSLPRFRCKCCGKTCNPLTGTPLARLRKREHWLAYSQCLIDGFTIRRSAKECHINKNTAFLWRHRFLQLIASKQPDKESGIVEADETFFLKSDKGQRHLGRPPRSRGGVSQTKGGGSADQVSVLIVRDRSGQTADFMLEKLDAKHVGEALSTVLASDACLCTDKAAVYSAFAKRNGVQHETITASGPRSRGPFHIQNVNAYDSRLKGWIARFRGVATSYLANYLGWHRMLDRYKYQLSKRQCLSEVVGWSATAN